MPAVIKIALGNLWEHKSKTLILGLLIMLGVMIIVLGNAFLESNKKSLQNDFTANYTGDIMIHGPQPEEGVVTILGVSQKVTINSIPKTPAIADIKKISSVIDEVNAETKNSITDETALITTLVMLSTENVDEDFYPDDDVITESPYGYVFAGDTNTYYSFFDGINILEGTTPSATEPTILIDVRVKEKFEKYYKIPLNVGDKVLATGMYSTSMTLREVTVCGFYSQPNPTTAMMTLCYLDPNTARSFAGLTYGSVYAEDLPDTVDTSLSEFSEDDLFGSSEDFMFDFSDSAVKSTAFTDDEIDGLLGDTSLRDKLNTVDDGAWNFVLLRVKNQNEAPSIINALNTAFEENGMDLHAVDWAQAAYDYVSTGNMLSSVFTVLIAVLAVVVFIVIMNTLIVSVIERTSEIGTMRALGAKRGFIRGLFFTEAVSISVIASILGVIFALILCAILNSMNITIASENARMFLGGGSIAFIPSFGSIISTIIVIVFGSALANLYPVSVALKVTPLKAMTQE